MSETAPKEVIGAGTLEARVIHDDTPFAGGLLGDDGDAASNDITTCSPDCAGNPSPPPGGL